jgi:plasmid maintenance system killer protein
MKRETWLRGSLIINVFLAVTIGWMIASRPRPQTLPSGQPADTAKSLLPEEHRLVPRATTPSPNPASGRETATGWSQWIDALRTAGVPNKVLARLVLADFDDRWQKRMDDILQKFQRGDLDQDALTAANQERQTEQDRELRAALGEEGFKLWDQENLLQSFNLKNIKISTSETNALYELQKQLQQQSHELDEKRQKGEIDDTDFNEKQSQLQAAFDQRVKALLGDERYAAMQGVDDGSGELRRNLRKLNATDAQFESLLQVQHDWTERRAELDRQLQQNQSLGVAYEEKIQDIDAARDQEYQRVLGTNAFDTLQREQDERYAMMKRYAGAWGIDDGNIDYIYRTIKYYEKNVQDYRQQARQLEQSGQPVDWNAINNNLEQFSQQTEKALHDYLGDDRFSKIKRNQVLPFEPR